MTQGIAQTFSCPQCAKRFTWKPEFNGRKIACGCGRVFKADLGFQANPTTDAPYAVGNTDKSPASAPKPRDNVLAAYPQRKKIIRPITSELHPEDENPLKHIYFPWALLIAGMAFRIAQIFYGTHNSLQTSIILVIIDVHLNALLMLGGAYAAASFLGVDLGTLSRASIKLAAIAIFADAAATWAIVFGHQTMESLVLGLHIALLIYFILFYAMFELDIQESLVMVVFVWVLQWILQVALFSIVH